MTDIQANFYDKAAAEITEAAKADDAVPPRYADALRHYDAAVTIIINALKWDQIPQRKAIYEAKAMECMDRMELIKVAMANPSDAAGGAGTVLKKPGEPDDASKLKDSLKGTIAANRPRTSWDDVAGLEGAKETLKEAVVLPVRFPQLFTGERKPWKGILLYGPPGTGKSYLAQAVATELAGCFMSVSAADIFTKWQGEAEQKVREVFKIARENSPTVIFIDEIDAIASERGGGNEAEASRRVKNEFLIQMSGVGKGDENKGILVLAATNVPWEVDPAFRRRFEKRVYIPLPEARARARMFELNLGKTPHSLTQADYTALGAAAAGFSGSDISVVVREALMEPLRKCRMARYWRAVPPAAPGGAPRFTPIAGAEPGVDQSDPWRSRVPPCSRCHLAVGAAPQAPLRAQCATCGALRMDLLAPEKDGGMKPEELFVPVVVSAARRARACRAGKRARRALTRLRAPRPPPPPVYGRFFRHPPQGAPDCRRRGPQEIRGVDGQVWAGRACRPRAAAAATGARAEPLTAPPPPAPPPANPRRATTSV